MEWSRYREMRLEDVTPRDSRNWVLCAAADMACETGQPAAQCVDVLNAMVPCPIVPDQIRYVKNAAWQGVTWLRKKKDVELSRLMATRATRVWDVVMQCNGRVNGHSMSATTPATTTRRVAPMEGVVMDEYKRLMLEENWDGLKTLAERSLKLAETSGEAAIAKIERETEASVKRLEAEIETLRRSHTLRVDAKRKELEAGVKRWSRRLRLAEAALADD